MAEIGERINAAPIPEAIPRSCNCGRMYRIVVVLAFAFTAPIAIMYWHTPDRPGVPSEHSQSFRPAEDVILKPALDPDAALSQMKGAWNLVFLGGGECGDACRDGLQKLSRLSAAPEQNARRVDRVWLVPRESNVGQLRGTLAPNSEVTVLTVDVPNVAALHRRLDPATTHVPGTIYVLDPLGNLVRRYPPDAEPAGVLNDLERLISAANP